MALPEIDVTGLCFSYGHRPVLRGVDFSLQAGVTGLLGQNGAGKTTLLRLIVGELKPTSGTVSVADGATDQMIGFLPQRFDVLGGATVQRNVEYAAWARGVDAADCELAAFEALECVGLSGQVRQRARTLSGGMRQRLGIACVIVNHPSVLLLDEPTVGLDPVQRVQMRKLLETIGQDACVLISTHMIDDLAATATNALVLNGGRIVFQGPTSGLANMGHGHDMPGITEYEAGYMSLLEGQRHG